MITTRTDGSGAGVTRWIKVFDDCTYSTTITTSTCVQTKNYPTAATPDPEPIIYYQQKQNHSLGDLKRMIVRMEELNYNGWKQEFKAPINKAKAMGMFLTFIINRRTMFSKSGYIGLKGRRYRN